MHLLTYKKTIIDTTLGNRMSELRLKKYSVFFWLSYTQFLLQLSKKYYSVGIHRAHNLIVICSGKSYQILTVHIWYKTKGKQTHTLSTYLTTEVYVDKMEMQR